MKVGTGHAACNSSDLCKHREEGSGAHGRGCAKEGALVLPQTLCNQHEAWSSSRSGNSGVGRVCSGLS